MKAFYEYKEKLLNVTIARLNMIERSLKEYTTTNKPAQTIDREQGLAIGSTSKLATTFDVNRGRARRKTTTEEQELVVELYQDNHLIKEIAARTNLTHKSIYYILNKHGIPRRSQQPRHPIAFGKGTQNGNAN